MFSKNRPRFTARSVTAWFVACGLAVIVASKSHAATVTWTGASVVPSNSNWSNLFNWASFLVPSNDGTADVRFGSTSRTSPVADAAWNVNSLTFLSSASQYTTTGAVLTIQSGGISNNSILLQTIGNGISANPNQTWSATSGPLRFTSAITDGGNALAVTGNFNTTFDGALAGSGGLNKSGNGDLNLNAAGTFAGNASINTGRIVLGDGLALQNATATINVDNGLNLNGLAAVTLSGLAGSGDLNVGSTVLTVGNNDEDSTYDGTFTGTGRLLKTGTGVFGATGGTAATPSALYRVGVNAGTMSVSGHINASSTSSSGSGDEALNVGNATLNVSGGGVLSTGSSGRVVVDGTDANLVVTGAGSELHGGFQFTIGLNTAATVIVQNGGLLSTTSNLVVGLQGTATGNLTVSNGGHVTTGSGILGALGSSVGTVLVTDTGSDWTANYLGLGGASPAQNGGAGHMTIKDGGKVTINGTTEFWTAASTLVIDRGALLTQSVNNTSGTAVIQVSDPVGGTGLTLGINDTTSTLTTRITNGPSGAGGLKKVGSGNLDVSNFNTYTGRTTVEGGTLHIKGGGSMGSFTANAGTTITFQNGPQVNLGFGDIIANGSVIYDNAVVNGGFLKGAGHSVASGGVTFNGVQSFTSAVLTQGQPATLNNFNNGGRIENNATMTVSGMVNGSSGTLNVNNTINATDLSSDGVINVATTGTLNHSGSSLVLGGGSRTSIGNKNAPNTGGAITLAGKTLELNGGLLVNNGTISGGLVNINFGGLAKGAGNYAGGFSVNDGGRIIFGNSPGTLHSGAATWGAGGEFDFEINDANGLAGTNWGLNVVNGTLAINAGTTAASKFLVKLNTLDASNAPGSMQDFNPSQSYDWTVVTATGGITGFNPAEFAIDTSAFVNNFGGGSFSVIHSGNSVEVHFAAVPEPASLALLLSAAACWCLRRRHTA
jgi:fibronectin-binding autotransporter adhesin